MEARLAVFVLLRGGETRGIRPPPWRRDSQYSSSSVEARLAVFVLLRGGETRGIRPPPWRRDSQYSSSSVEARLAVFVLLRGGKTCGIRPPPWRRDSRYSSSSVEARLAVFVLLRGGETRSIRPPPWRRDSQYSSSSVEARLAVFVLLRGGESWTHFKRNASGNFPGFPRSAQNNRIRETGNEFPCCKYKARALVLGETTKAFLVWPQQSCKAPWNARVDETDRENLLIIYSQRLPTLLRTAD